MGLTKPKIVGGVSLPDLTNPAEASDILTGKEAIAEDGGVLAGSHVCKQLHELFPALSNPAGAADVASGKQFVDSNGAVVSGTLEMGAIMLTLKYDTTANVLYNNKNCIRINGQYYTSDTKFEVARGTVVVVETYSSNVGSTINGNTYTEATYNLVMDRSYTITFNGTNAVGCKAIITENLPAEVVDAYTDVASNANEGRVQSLTIPDLKGKENFLITLLYEGEHESTNSKTVYDTYKLVTAVRKIGNTIQVFGLYGGSTTYQIYHCGTKTGASFDSNTGTITLPNNYSFYYIYSYWSNYGNYRYAYSHYYYVGW